MSLIIYCVLLEQILACPSLNCHIKEDFLGCPQIFFCLNRALSFSLYIVSFGPLSSWSCSSVSMWLLRGEVMHTSGVVLQVPERGEKALSLT